MQALTIPLLAVDAGGTPFVVAYGARFLARRVGDARRLFILVIRVIADTNVLQSIEMHPFILKCAEVSCIRALICLIVPDLLKVVSILWTDAGDVVQVKGAVVHGVSYAITKILQLSWFVSIDNVRPTFSL